MKRSDFSPTGLANNQEVVDEVQQAAMQALFDALEAPSKEVEKWRFLARNNPSLETVFDNIASASNGVSLWRWLNGKAAEIELRLPLEDDPKMRISCVLSLKNITFTLRSD